MQLALNGFKKSLLVYLVIFAVSAVVGFVLARPSGAAEAGEAKAYVAGNWNEGDSRSLTVKAGKQKDLGGRVTDEEITYDVAIKVIGEDKDGYTIEWVYSNIAYSGENPFVNKLYKTSEGLKVVYRTDPDGMFMELVNWKEVQEHLYGALDLLEKEFPESQAISAVIGQFKAMYSSRESIENTLRDIQIYHSPYGGEYTLGEWTSTETTLPNHLGGYPFPAVIKTGMTELDQVNNRCKILSTQAIDGRRAAQAMKEFLRTASRMGGGGAPSWETDLSSVSINDEFEYDVELEGGWVSKAFYKRENQTGGAKGVNTYEMTLKR